MSCSSATGFAACATEALSGLYVKNYAAVGTFSVSQRISILNATTPDSWPAEVDINPTRYVEFAVTTTGGRTLVVDTVSLYAGAAGGNGMGFRIQYSLQSDFGNATDLGNYPTNASNTMTQLSFPSIITVGPTDTLRLRVYPWYKSVAATKYLCLQSLVVHGTAQ
jgi:hypothetical protein